MIDTHYTYSTNNKRFNTFSLSDNEGNSYLFVRSLGKRKGFFNIAKCEINSNGHIDDNDELIPDATWFSDEEVAELVGQSEKYQERLARAEAALREWIDFRNTWARKGRRKLSLQKKEVVK
jgi:hypothetical protein